MFLSTLCIPLLLTLRAIAAPASIPAPGLQSTGPPLPLLPLTLNTSHPFNLTLPAPYSSISGSGTTLKISWVWPVPNTDLILFLDSFPNQPVNKASLLNTLDKIENRMNVHLRWHHDGWLTPADDPIDEPIKNIATAANGVNDQQWHVTFKSNPWRGPYQKEEHLTYTTVVSVLDTWKELINGIMGACHTIGGIQSSEWGLMGSMAAVPPGY